MYEVLAPEVHRLPASSPGRVDAKVGRVMRADRPSLTAIKVARGIVFVAEEPRARELLPPAAAMRALN